MSITTIKVYVTTQVSRGHSLNQLDCIVLYILYILCVAFVDKCRFI